MDKKLFANALSEIADSLVNEQSVKKVKIGINTIGSEHGQGELLKGAALAMKKDPRVLAAIIGPEAIEGFAHIEATDEDSAAKAMEKALDSGDISACITQHYTFPIGVSTVGRVVSPANGKEIYIATTTGTSAINRVEAMVRNAVAGIVAAKACGVARPTVGILNVEGARTVEKHLIELQKRGYDFDFGASKRADGGAVLRGNDLITGAVDVVVTDSLTGNILMKLFSSFNSGGEIEVAGYGYGPGIGKDYSRKIFILSRASGAQVAANAFNYALEIVQGNVTEVAKKEYAALSKLNWEDLFVVAKPEAAAQEVKAPEKVVVTGAIAGVDILELEDAVQALWSKGIYAESGMGCTGPIVMVPDTRIAECVAILEEKGFIASQKKDC